MLTSNWMCGRCGLGYHLHRLHWMLKWYDKKPRKAVCREKA